MDQQKLRLLVFEKTGVKIDIDDPIFALVALNEAVLAEAVERHVDLMDEATADLADQLQALQDSGSLCRYQGADGVRAPAGKRAGQADTAATSAAPAAGLAAQDQRIMAIAGGAAVLCALLVLSGQALLFKAPSPAPPGVIAKELTPEQVRALADGAKLQRIIETLDPKTRKLISTEMQKP